MEEFFHRTRPALTSRPAAELEQAVHHASFDHHAAVPPEAVPLEAVPLAAPPQETAPQATVLNKADPLVAVPHAVPAPFEAVPRTTVPSLSDRVEQSAVIPQPGKDDHVEPNPAAFSRPPVSLPRLTFLPAVPSSHAGAPLSLQLSRWQNPRPQLRGSHSSNPLASLVGSCQMLMSPCR